MSTTPNEKKKTYLDLSDKESGGGHKAPVFWTAKEPDRIHLAIDDPRFVDADGNRPGLRIVFSANPKSADYSPGNFNRIARVLRSLGMPAPEHDVPEHPRHLRYRDSVIKEVGGQVGDALPVPAVPDDAVVCGQCFCYVADLTAHEAAVHA